MLQVQLSNLTYALLISRVATGAFARKPIIILITRIIRKIPFEIAGTAEDICCF